MHYNVQQNVIHITIGHYNFCCNKLAYNIKIQQEFLCLCKDKSTKFMMSVDDQKTFLEERQDRIIDIISWTEVIGRHVVENVNDDVTFWQGPRLLITNITIKHNYCIIDHSIGICWILSSSDNGIRRASSQPEQWLAPQPAPPTTHRLIRDRVTIRIAPKRQKQQTSRRGLDNYYELGD